VIGDNGLALVNQAGGTINANASGYSLILNGGGLITNAGLLEATNGGVLQIQDTVANQGGNITANAAPCTSMPAGRSRVELSTPSMAVCSA